MIIKGKTQLEQIIRNLKNNGNQIIFTNGCFDIIHAGHIQYLKEAKALGDILIVGVNSDDSVKRLKGANRPINFQDDRLIVLDSLKSVDYVILFDKDTPFNLISSIIPDILVKGGDWEIKDIVGADIVIKNNGIVKSLSFKKGISTTEIIQRIKKNEL